ncbi:hypothetical protein JS87_09765 [Vibrio vulnificus]|nr:hypothetical protein JS87_09765 [Vibrio vulnificus]KFK56591.1 hypothetical protein JS86_05490 [Vibrio vulnificus]
MLKLQKTNKLRLNKLSLRYKEEKVNTKYKLFCSIPMILFSCYISAEDVEEFKLNYLSKQESEIPNNNNSIIASGLGVHTIKAGEAVGWYLSGLKSISDTDFGVYMRGELISDKYKTGSFWSWNLSIGAGYYLNDDVIPYVSVGKCFSNYSTCYFNLRHPTQNDDDIDAIYYGGGAFIKEPFFNNYMELGANWSPYNGYNGLGIFLGYGVSF